MRRMDKEDRASWSLFWLCFAVYVVVSMAKSVYSASIASIVSEGLFQKAEAGIISSAFYLLYGGGQLFGGKFIDRTSPILLLSISIGGSILAVIGMGLAESFTAMLIIWILGGFVQFAVWPAVLRILAEYLLPMHRQRAMTYISFAYAIGMLLNYVMATVVLEFFTWRMLFFVEAAILCLVFLAWVCVAKRTTTILKEANSTYKPLRYQKGEEKTEKKESVGTVKLILTSGVFFMLVPAFVRCCLDLGVKTWVPTMIMESYSGISASFATMLTTILVVINLAGVFIVNYMYPRYIKNAALAFAMCFLVSLPFTALLLLTGKISVWLIVAMLVVITTMMYAGNRMIVVIIPSFFTEYGRVGSVAGIINAIASFGAVVSNYGYGLLAEKFGWNGTIISWIILAVVAVILSCASVPRWKKFTNEG